MSAGCVRQQPRVKETSPVRCRQVNWRAGGVVLSKQARRGSLVTPCVRSGVWSRSRASHPRLPSAEFDQVSFLLPRECPHALSSSPSAHPILPAPSTFATDTRLVALIACIPLSDRNSQLTRTRAEDCARCLLILKDTRLPSLSVRFLSFGPNSFTPPAFSFSSPSTSLTCLALTAA